MISVNGRNYSGNNISITNGKVVIDGKVVTNSDEKEIVINIDSNVEKLSVDACSEINIIGDVGELSSKSGNIKITGNVTGDVSNVSGNISCSGTIGGDASTVSGNVHGGRR